MTFSHRDKIVLFLLVTALSDAAHAIWRIPRYIAVSLNRRRREIRITLRETERLDRIRNPAKYLGK
jgi:hypothetical protein